MPNYSLTNMFLNPCNLKYITTKHPYAIKVVPKQVPSVSHTNVTT